MLAGLCDQAVALALNCAVDLSRNGSARREGSEWALSCIDSADWDLASLRVTPPSGRLSPSHRRPSAAQMPPWQPRRESPHESIASSSMSGICGPFASSSLASLIHWLRVLIVISVMSAAPPLLSRISRMNQGSSKYSQRLHNAGLLALCVIDAEVDLRILRQRLCSRSRMRLTSRLPRRIRMTRMASSSTR